METGAGCAHPSGKHPVENAPGPLQALFCLNKSGRAWREQRVEAQLGCGSIPLIPCPGVSVLAPNTHSEGRKEQHKALGKRFPGNGVTEILEEMELLARSRAVFFRRSAFG